LGINSSLNHYLSLLYDLYQLLIVIFTGRVPGGLSAETSSDHPTVQRIIAAARFPLLQFRPRRVITTLDLNLSIID
jgi:hypothetical protein